MPVLYEDPLNLVLRQKYHFPPYLVQGYQTFAENIQKHPLLDPAGAQLSSIAEFAAARQGALSELECQDQLFKRIKLLNVQSKSGTEAYEAESKVLLGQEDLNNYLQVCELHDPLVMLNDVQFMERSNPIAEKFHILTRDDSVASNQLKPNAMEQAEIDKLQTYPDFVVLSQEQKSLFWRYRYSQKKNRKVLVKFLLSVKWDSQKEQQEAMNLLHEWETIELE